VDTGKWALKIREEKLIEKEARYRMDGGKKCQEYLMTKR
jgi:hypothetical protein